MKILVLGATGMAGHIIALYLNEQGHNITAFSRKPFLYCDNITGDVLDFELLKKIIQGNSYDAVINAIGILNQNAENNKSEAILINGYLPHFLSQFNVKIIHISTDCVFSGTNGGYTENSIRDGSSFYDRSKALGELEGDKDLTFRMSIIGPDMNENGIGLFNWFMKQKGTINGYTKAIWTGVTTLTLSKAIEDALVQNLTGLYQLVNRESISKYELLCLFNKYFRYGRIKILPVDGVSLDKSLINTRTDFSFSVPSYENMIIDMKNWIEAHENLYCYELL